MDLTLDISIHVYGISIVPCMHMSLDISLATTEVMCVFMTVDTEWRTQMDRSWNAMGVDVTRKERGWNTGGTWMEGRWRRIDCALTVNGMQIQETVDGYSHGCIQEYVQQYCA